MNIAICGPGYCGKDTVVDWLKDNTSLVAAPGTSMIIAPHVAEKLNINVEKAFEERRNNRPFWYNVGRELCKDDPAFLVKECLKQGNLIQGLRDKQEFESSRDIIDLFIWIYRRVESDSTIKFKKENCDITIENTGTLESLHRKLKRISKGFKL